MLTRHSTPELIDEHFAGSLGCFVDDLRNPGVTIIPYEPDGSPAERTPPKPMWMVLKDRSLVVSAETWVTRLIEPLFTPYNNPATMSHAPLSAIKSLIERRVEVWFWFLGYQLYCDAVTFKPKVNSDCRRVTIKDPVSAELADRHCLAFNDVSFENGDVFGIFDGDELVSYSWIKPRSDLASAIGVVTLEKYRRRGFGRDVVSAAAQEILDRGKIPIYDCDQDNTASLKLAQSLGFGIYCEDFGCIQRISRS